LEAEDEFVSCELNMDLAWTLNTESSLEYVSSLSTRGDILIAVSTYSDQIIAIDIPTGTVLWQYHYPGYIYSYLPPSSTSLHICTADSVYSTDISTGDVTSLGPYALCDYDDLDIWTQGAYIVDGINLRFLTAGTTVGGVVCSSLLVGATPHGEVDFIAPGRLTCPPVVVGSKLYMGTGQGWVECTSGRLHILDLNTLSEITRRKFDDPVQEIVIEGEYLYVLTAQDYMYSYAGTIHAIDMVTGRDLWSLSGIFGDSSPLLLDDVILLGLCDEYPIQGGVVALDRATGARRWQYSIKSSLVRPTFLVTNGEHIFFGEKGLDGGVYTESGHIHALDHNGNEVWVYEANGPIHQVSLSDTGYLIAACGGGEILCFK